MRGRLNTRITVTIASSAFAAVPLAGAAPDAAAAGPLPTSGTHCVQAATPVGGSPGSPVCFARFDDAISFATGGQVHLVDAASSRLVTPAELVVPSPLTGLPISIMYADAGYGGASFTWTGTACTTTHSYAEPSMPSGWNDRVGSMHVYQNCNNTLYADISYGGASVSSGRNGSESSLGALNDKGSSQAWVF
jgi:hypothetical protein